MNYMANLAQKNANFNERYLELINELKKLNLYGNWFIDTLFNLIIVRKFEDEKKID